MALYQLYRHFDKSGNLLYVGQSLNAMARFVQHNRTAVWAKDIAFVEIERFATAEDLREAEALAIASENPIYNISRPTLPGETPPPIKRGRPRILGPRPWEAEGISRRTWYRRKAEGN